MNPEEHDDLWRLLGKAKPTVVSPFFARNVLRAIRAQEQSAPAKTGFWGFCGFWILVRQNWQLTSMAIVLIGILSVSIWPQPDQGDLLADLAQEVSISPDYAVIGHLDELLAYEENSVWLDNSGD